MDIQKTDGAHQMIECGLATEERWKNLLSKFSKKSMISLDIPYNRITTVYNKLGRHYHNLNHISTCLEEFDSVGKSSFEYPLESEVAIWFHDFIYFINDTNNEEKSALVANGYLWSLGFSPEQRNKVRQIILATSHNETVTDNDSQLVCDIDLATFGKPKKIFTEYEQNIREEYYSIPDVEYYAARMKILKKFLARDNIYYSQFFRKKYELEARRNIFESIEELQRVSRYL